MCDTNTLNLILMELRNIKALMQKQPTYTFSIYTPPENCKDCNGTWLNIPYNCDACPNNKVIITLDLDESEGEQSSETEPKEKP